MVPPDDARTRPVPEVPWPPPPPEPGSPLAIEFAEVLGAEVTVPGTAPPIPRPARVVPGDGPSRPPGPPYGPSDATLPPRPAVTRPSPGAPAMVPAVACPGGHPNPPAAATCRSCGAPVTDRSVRGVEQPVLGALRLADGSTIALDGPLLLGRNPAPESTDDQACGLVRLADPDRVLSRTHVEVRPVRWQVLVTDRGSTNGTAVRSSRGTTPITPHAPVELGDGDELVLGGAVSISFTTAP